MPYLGRNKCLATGFTRLFCPIEENISMDDTLQLPLYLKTTNRVEHLTVAVTRGGRQIQMSLSNRQMIPAEQVKIILVQGHLVVTDINLHLNIRVEYGWDCEDFSLAVPAGFSATRYRRFDAENVAGSEGNNVITLPSCFRVIPNSVKIPATTIISARLPSSSSSTPPSEPDIYADEELEWDENEAITPDIEKSHIQVDSGLENTTSNWNSLRNNNEMSSSYKLIYFAGRGLAETSRMLFKAAGEEFEDYRYPIIMKDCEFSRPEWDADKSKYIYEKLPVLEIDGGKHTIAQSKAIERFLARRFNMLGSNDIEAAIIEAAGEQIGDVNQAYNKAKPEGADAVKKFFEGDLKKTFTAFEKQANQNKSGYFMGSSLSLFHIQLYNLIHFFDDQESVQKALADCPNLKAIHDKVEQTPAIKKWLAERP
ncbi:unnamed protein product [Adineta steineri]|uniref:GST N-terminal domain-containing protein n=1 Tax=Adineta steineri TaxID=433720 RepID=A0A813ZGW6_9BILA|nr:unnamed protein product [Adineta steineri]